MQALDPNRSRRWQEQSRLQEQLDPRFYHLGEAVADADQYATGTYLLP